MKSCRPGVAAPRRSEEGSLLILLSERSSATILRRRSSPGRTTTILFTRFHGTCSPVRLLFRFTMQLRSLSSSWDSTFAHTTMEERTRKNRSHRVSVTRYLQLISVVTIEPRRIEEDSRVEQPNGRTSRGWRGTSVRDGKDGKHRDHDGDEDDEHVGIYRGRCGADRRLVNGRRFFSPLSIEARRSMIDGDRNTDCLASRRR